VADFMARPETEHVMADADTGPEPLDEKALLSDIDRTRAELARTIDAISDRVSPAKNIERAKEEFRQRADRAFGQARQRADRTLEQARQRGDRTLEQARQRADQTMEQVGQRAGKIDPFVVGVAAATAAVAVAVTALFLWRRRDH
jgi:vacuolar-type H+-ATPase subunit H